MSIVSGHEAYLKKPVIIMLIISVSDNSRSNVRYCYLVAKVNNVSCQCFCVSSSAIVWKLSALPVPP